MLLAPLPERAGLLLMAIDMCHHVAAKVGHIKAHLWSVLSNLSDLQICTPTSHTGMSSSRFWEASPHSPDP